MSERSKPKVHPQPLRNQIHRSENVRVKSDSSSSKAQKIRTSHACDRCRLMRTKCSGSVRCSKCIKDGAVCVYGDRKRERNRKDLAESVKRVDILEGENRNLLLALQSLVDSPSFSPERHGDVVELLILCAEADQTDGRGEGDPDSSSHSRSTQSVFEKTETELRGENSNDLSLNHQVSHVGSPRSQGVLNYAVDLDFGMGAPGYFGKMSETSWIQKIRQYLATQSMTDHSGPPGYEHGQNLVQPQNLTYFMDDINLLSVDEDHVHAHEMPPLTVALLLSEAFFHAVQGVFQFLDREVFVEKLVIISQAQVRRAWSERAWLAVANIVWAIGAKWLQMTKLDHQHPIESHLMYFARARALGLDHRILFDHPDLERLQGIGLLAFYLMINGSVARAFMVAGNAVRLATSLGLNLTVADPAISPDGCLRRAQTWYSLYNLEVLLSEMLARPKSISLDDVTVSIDIVRIAELQTSEYERASASRKMWLEFLNTRRDNVQGMTGGLIPWQNFANIGESVSADHFPCHVQLCQISDRVARQLYSALQTHPWSETQRKIGELQNQLRRWAEDLPGSLSIHSYMPSKGDPRAKIEMLMYYHSVEMMLHRPCLYDSSNSNESQRSQEFSRMSARACVHAAIALLNVLPENPTVHESYQLLPWWALLHYIAQAMAILLLELCLRAQHFPGEVGLLVNAIRKAMTYLWCMTESSVSAYKAWQIFRHLLVQVARLYGSGPDGLEIADIPELAIQPPEWTDEDARNLERELHDFVEVSGHGQGTIFTMPISPRN